MDKAEEGRKPVSWVARSQRSFQGSAFSLQSCPRRPGISLDPCPSSFWLVLGASGKAQEESPGATSRGRQDRLKGVERGVRTLFRLFQCWGAKLAPP